MFSITANHPCKNPDSVLLEVPVTHIIAFGTNRIWDQFYCMYELDPVSLVYSLGWRELYFHS